MPEYSSLAKEYMKHIHKNCNIFGEFEFPKDLFNIGSKFDTIIVAEGEVIIQNESLNNTKTITSTN